MRLPTALLLAALLVAGCGGSDSVSVAPQPAAPATTPAPAPAPAPEPAPSPVPPPQRSGTAVAPIDATSRAAVVARWYDTYFDNTPFSWTGSISACAAGDTTQAFREAVVRRLNFFRSMAGLPGDLALDDALSAKAQKAALMMDAADRLSHAPTPDWPCYSAEGAEAAGTSLLAYSNAPGRGVSLVDGYMRDRGANNAAVGHRRWILYPPLATVGTGDVPQANALWIVMPARTTWAEGAAAIAWPPRGFMPRALTEPTDRFSLSCPGASFGTTSVVMRGDSGQTIHVRVESRSDIGYGDNSIVWSIDTARSPASSWDRGSADTRVDVEVTGVSNCAAGGDFSYSVTFITP